MFTNSLPQVVQPLPLMDQADPPQFVTGHLSVWDEDVGVGMMQDVGVVHYMGVEWCRVW